MSRRPKVKIFLVLALTAMVVTTVLPGMASAESSIWSYVGKAGFSSQPVIHDSSSPQVTSVSLFMYQGTPYVAYQDTGYNIVVSEHIGGSWQPVGQPVANTGSGYVSSVSLFVDDGIPSVAYQDVYGVEVSVYDPGTGKWDLYGGVNADRSHQSQGNSSVSLSMYQDKPYVAYQDVDTGVDVSVYDPTAGWKDLGSAGQGLDLSSISSSISLFVDAGTPYVAYQDGDYIVDVCSYDSASASWAPEGVYNGPSLGGYSPVSLFVDGGTPYVAYQDQNNNGAVWVEMYDQANGWQPVGGSAGPGVSPSSLSLFVDGVMPYVAYQDNNGTVWAQVYDQANGWQPVGGTSVGSASTSSTVSLFVDPGTPYVAYVDGTASSRASVKYLATYYTVSVSVSPTGGGTVSGNNGPYAAGASVSLTANPASGYTFTNWTNTSGSAVSSDNPYTFTMPASDVSLTANFQATTGGGGGGIVIPALTVSPPSATVTVGGTRQFTATYYQYGQGSTGQDVTDDCQWSTADQNTATVDQTGLATGVKQGITDVFAGYDGLKAQATLTVTPPVNNLPAGAILDRQIGSVSAGHQAGGTVDGATYQPLPSATITMPIDTQAPDAKHTIEVYHWQPLPLPGTNFPGRWVALATTMDNGRAVAVNDGNYTGWFAAWWVVKPHFTDIAGSWAVNDIRRLNGLGMVEGYPGPENGLDRAFGPDRPITRAELTTIAARILGLNPGTHAYTVLAPLPAAETATVLQKAYKEDWSTIPEWAAPYVAAMTQAGYVHGMDGNFNPGEPMTRIQAGVLMSNILRAVGYTTPADLSRFHDAGSIPSWARGRLLDDVLQGDNGLLRPNNTITRAEESTLLLRLFRTLGW